MKMWIIAALCMMCCMLATSPALGETVDLGPAHVSVDLTNLGSCSVDKGPTSSTDHPEREADFTYTIYPAAVTVEDTSDKVLIEVHEMSTPMSLDTAISERDTSTGLKHCIEQSGLISGKMDLQTEPYQVDGHEGVLAEVEGDGKDPMYIVAYSPDEIDGSGKIVCIVGSDFPWETTKAVFDSLDVKTA
jgi:hypothetical protein